MMAGMHPEELELLAYLEGELDDPRRGEVASHLETCDSCAQELRAVETGRAALRSAPMLELPAERLEALLTRLPARAATPPGFLRRALPVAAALAAVAALAGGAFVLGTGGGGDNGAGSDASGGDVERSSGDSAETAAQGADGSATATSGSSSLKSVTGSAQGVASRLRRRGFDARVSGDRVIVRGARAEEVRKALEPLGPGPVEVVVRP